MKALFVLLLAILPVLAQPNLQFTPGTAQTWAVYQWNGHKLAAFDLGMVNVGDEDFDLGTGPNVFATWASYTIGMWGATITDQNGHSRDIIGLWSAPWTGAYFQWPWTGGLAPGQTALSEAIFMGLWDGAYLDLTALPNGIYHLKLTLDPLGVWGQRDPSKDLDYDIEFEYWQVRIYEGGSGG